MTPGLSRRALISLAGMTILMLGFYFLTSTKGDSVFGLVCVVLGVIFVATPDRSR